MLSLGQIVKSINFQTTAFKCDKEFSESTSRSQSGEDKILLSYFGNLCGGRYIEFGALDGML